MDLGDLSCSKESILRNAQVLWCLVAYPTWGVLPALYRWLGVGTRVQVGYMVGVQDGNSSLTCMVSRELSVSL